jgi:hypothetical protein
MPPSRRASTRGRAPASTPTPGTVAARTLMPCASSHAPGSAYSGAPGRTARLTIPPSTRPRSRSSDPNDVRGKSTARAARPVSEATARQNITTPCWRRRWSHRDLTRSSRWNRNSSSRRMGRRSRIEKPRRQNDGSPATAGAMAPSIRSTSATICSPANRSASRCATLVATSSSFASRRHNT